jgi:uncharacterized GH25 family protein
MLSFTKRLALPVWVMLALPIMATAHEFWLEPISFWGSKMTIRIKVGEHFSGENWKGDFTKVRMLAMLNHQQAYDMDPHGLLANKGDSIQLSLPYAGTQTLIFNSTNSYIQLNGTDFNAYLQEDGLTDVIAWRKANKMDTAGAREYYQRSVKTLLQNGSATTAVNYPTQLPLDIVPLSNPYDLKATGTIKFTVYFQQRLLKEGRIKAWHISKDGKLNQQDIQLKEGSFSLPVEPEGKWMVSIVKMVPHTADDTADWQSYWASCTWGYF